MHKKNYTYCALLGAIVLFAFFGNACDVAVSENKTVPPIGVTDAGEAMGPIIPATEFYEQSTSEYSGVRFVIENASIQGVDIYLENDHQYCVMLGQGFTLIELNEDGTLKLLEPRNDYVFTSELTIPSQVIYLQNHFLDFNRFFDFNINPGTYRFVTTVRVSNEPGTEQPDLEISDFREVSFYVDFTITE